MFETQLQREKRERAEASDREARVKAYERTMGVQLPYSPVAVVERQMAKDMNALAKMLRNPSDVVIAPESPLRNHVEVLERNQSEADPVLRNQPKRDRAAYMKKYRAKEKKCPHCGGKL